MYYTFCVIDLLALGIVLSLFFFTLRFVISQSKTGFLGILLSLMVLILGMYLELTMSDTLNAALMALKIQYFGLIEFTICLPFFISKIAKFHVPQWVYNFIVIIMTPSYLSLLFTSGKEGKNNGLFYSSMKIVTEGAYSRISASYGVMWYIFYVVHAVVFIGVMVKLMICAVKSRNMHRKRCLIMFFGMSVVLIELVLKGVFHLFGSYNPYVCALMVMILCMYFAILKSGYLNSINAAAVNALNHGEEGVIVLDENCNTIYINDILKSLMPELTRLKKANEHTAIFEILYKNKRRVEINSKVYEAKVEIINDHDALSGYMIWFINVSKYYSRLTELNTQNKAKSQYLAVVSHEIRTPVNTIMGMNEMIRRTSHEEECIEYSENISSACEMLLSLLSEVLDISKIESGAMHVNEAEYKTSQLMQDVKKMCEQKAIEKGLTFSITSDEKLPALLMGDKTKIRQMIINLATNSIKYTDKGRINIEFGYNEGRLVISVADTGRGIKESDLERIFNYFERVDESGEGYGLGLTLTKQICDSMNGRIDVQSQFGKGSVFTISVPQTICEEPQPIEKAEQTDGPKPLFVAPDMKILAVDDNKMNLVVIKKLLERTQTQVDTAQSGEEAVQMVCEKKYDMILLDAMMPTMDGSQTLMKIRREPQSKCMDIPVIVVTANATAGMRERYLRDGFNDYISKPIKPNNLEEIIKRNMYTSPKIRKSHIDIQKGLSYSDNDMEFYRTLRNIFIEEIGATIEKLNEALENKDYYLYKVTVHALKNNAASIGAEEFSKLCLEAEKVSDNGELETLREFTKRITIESNEISAEIKTQTPI